ncbi:hypothetical protein LX59_01199 [Azomonas agilis]|uniref:Uncharacterized protein n=2 Tax=Azomonas agilis TaxID=116849 RepID=A0A562IZE5_9GAMM|nr:hypothetical protein LX59_01199 [Azomonas agilis]
MKHKEQLKEKYPSAKHQEIDLLSKSNIQDWIKNNMSRIEFLIKDNDDPFALGLLEALVQYHLKPIFEGKNA